jgi:hypothetical protein
MDGGEADTGCGAGSANASCAREVAGVRREQYSTRCCRYSSVAWAPHIHVALRRGASPSRAHALGDAREVRSDTPDRARLFPLFSPRCPCPTVRPCTRAEPAKIFRAARGSIIRSAPRRGAKRRGGPARRRPAQQDVAADEQARRPRAKATRQQQPPTSVSAEGVRQGA